jgi:hypothetical protein
MLIRRRLLDVFFQAMQLGCAWIGTIHGFWASSPAESRDFQVSFSKFALLH